jgi:hypothetical protein
MQARGDVMTRPVHTALVLAAGNGDRFKNPARESKLLQPFLGRPLIIRTLETARAAGIRAFEIVLGYRADRRAGDPSAPSGAADGRPVPGDTQSAAPPTLIYLPHAPSVPVPPSAKLAGLPIAERVVRAALRAGYSRIVMCTPEMVTTGAMGRGLRTLAIQVGSRIHVVNLPREWDAAIGSLEPAESVTIIGAATVVSSALLASAREISAETGRSVDVASGPAWPESGVLRMTAGDARDPEYVVGELVARSRRELPQPSGVDVSNGRAMLALRITNHAQLATAEETIRRANYKDTDAKIARFNPRISLPSA